MAGTADMTNEGLKLENGLNSPDREIRLSSLRTLKAELDAGRLEPPASGPDVNNHIHTTYSFSPYSPSLALWKAYRAGLCTAGIMDHDSVGGVMEFTEAGKIIGIPTTIGVECRASLAHTALAGRRINNPDQISVAYMALHGIPHPQVPRVDAFLKPYREARNRRNRIMVDRINALMQPHGIRLDFDRDVEPLSMARQGGSITERHLLFALAGKILDKALRGPALTDFVKISMGIPLSTKIESYLRDPQNPHLAYDLLGVLKSDLVERIYVDAGEECPRVEEVIRLAHETGAISAYAYLGDVGDSVTGDKKTQKFEDDYLDELFMLLRELGFNAVTYMPSRNTRAQLDRVRALCVQHGLFQISGEDINSPRQLFVCEALRNPGFENLIEATWALIGHERAASADPTTAMFSAETLKRNPDLGKRVKIYAEMGRQGV